MGEGMSFGKIVAIAIVLIALVVMILVLFPLMKNALDPFLSMIDDALGTKLSDQSNNLVLTAELSKDQRVTLKWTVKKPEQIGYFNIYKGYLDSYNNKEEIDIIYTESNRVAWIDKGQTDRNKKDFSWQSAKLADAGWYKFTVYAINTEGQEAIRKDVYVGFFDSTDSQGMQILFDETVEKERRLLESDMGNFISSQPTLLPDLPNLPADDSRRKTMIAGLSRKQVVTLFNYWLDPYILWLVKNIDNPDENALEYRKDNLMAPIENDLKAAPAVFESAGMIDVSKLN